MSILQFSEHFQFIFDNSNVNNDKQINKKWQIFFCKLLKIIKFFVLILLIEATLELKVAPTNRNSSPFLLHTSKIFSIFSQIFLQTNFRHQNKNNVVETISCFVYQLSKKYCVYYVSEHLKYCTQLNEKCLSEHSIIFLFFVLLEISEVRFWTVISRLIRRLFHMPLWPESWNRRGLVGKVLAY